MNSPSLEDLSGIYTRYGASVLKRCRELLGDESAAWDAMHETFIRAIRYRDSFRGVGSLLGWLQGIALRVCLDEHRRRPRLEGEPELALQSLEEPLASPEQRVHSQRAIAWLLPRFGRKIQELVVLRYFDELEVREIAQRTGLSERTVARRLSQFLTRSRRLLEAKP